MKQKRIVNKTLLNSYHNEPCLACGCRQTTVAHHIKSKKSGGHDIEVNLMPLCIRHHREIHDKGLSSFARKYGNAFNFLKDNDWYVCDYVGKWRNLEVWS